MRACVRADAGAGNGVLCPDPPERQEVGQVRKGTPSPAFPQQGPSSPGTACCWCDLPARLQCLTVWVVLCAGAEAKPAEPEPPAPLAKAEPAASSSSAEPWSPVRLRLQGGSGCGCSGAPPTPHRSGSVANIAQEQAHGVHLPVVSSISASELAECEKKTRVTTSMLIAV
jgi:hypothetical protein